MKKLLSIAVFGILIMSCKRKTVAYTPASDPQHNIDSFKIHIERYKSTSDSVWKEYCKADSILWGYASKYLQAYKQEKFKTARSYRDSINKYTILAKELGNYYVDSLKFPNN